MVSLGCPKALVDSERILTRLRAEGYAISPDYQGADAVIVNTCGFLDSAKAESLEAIGEALRENGRVIVTGCLGAEPDYITGAHPKVLAVTGPHQYEAVLDAVHAAVPPAPDPFIDLLPATRRQPDPAPLQLSEDFRRLQPQVQVLHHPRHARPAASAAPPMPCCARRKSWSQAGVRELLVISQDTSAYGVDRKHDLSPWKGGEVRAHITDLARDLGEPGRLGAAALRLPLPACPRPDPADGRGAGAALSRHPLPARPPRHAAPHGPPRRRGEDAGRDRRLARASAPTSPCARPSSSAIPARPRPSSRPCSTGWTRRNSTGSAASSTKTSQGARSNALPDHVPDEVKQDRWDRFMAKAQAISEAKLAAKVGQTLQVIVDEVDDEGATCRTKADAPEIDGNLFIDEGFEGLAPGDIVTRDGRRGRRLRPLGPPRLTAGRRPLCATGRRRALPGDEKPAGRRDLLHVSVSRP